MIEYTNEDCVAGMARLANDSIDLTVTSPPYDNLRKYNGYSFDFESIARDLFRITKAGGIVVWIVGDAVVNGSETGTSFRQALYFMECGFNLHDTMIYQKDSISFPETNRYSQVFEYMFVFSKGKPKTTNILKDRKNKWHDGTKIITGAERQKDGSLFGRRKGNVLKEYGSRFNVWVVPTGFMKSTTDKCAYKHPAIMPEKLAEDHILSWSNQGDTVLDPFMGSGTTAKMAHKHGRNFVGFELSDIYFSIAKQRLDDFMRQPRIDELVCDRCREGKT